MRWLACAIVAALCVSISVPAYASYAVVIAFFEDGPQFDLGLVFDSTRVGPETISGSGVANVYLYEGIPTYTNIPVSIEEDVHTLSARTLGDGPVSFEFLADMPESGTGTLTIDGVTRAFSIYEAYSSAPVPEPATWAMLILGLGLIGLTARRRTAGAALAA